MNPIASLHATPKGWLVNSALTPHLDVFAAYLERGRYAANTAKGYVAGIAHFARWMTQCHLPVQLLDEHTVEQFLGNHLPRCDCPTPVMRVHDDLRAALGHLLDVLREQGAIAQPAPPTGPIADELRHYDDHMRDVRGLSEGTRRGRLRIVQRLLLQKFAGRPVVIAELQPSDVRRFIAEQLELRGTASNATTMASAFRAYFRYRTTCGDRVHALAGVISSPAHWSLASLPRALSAAEVDRLLGSFTAALPLPRRGYAIVRCALDLGLRSSEVAKLALADIDWRAGTVTCATNARPPPTLPSSFATSRRVTCPSAWTPFGA